MILVLVSINKSCNLQNAPKDIRSAPVMNYLLQVDNTLREDSSVNSVTSAATIFSAMGGVPTTDSGVKTVLDNVPASKMFFNRDNSATILMVSATIGSSEEKINKFVSRVNENIGGIGKPACVSVVITGNPPLRSTLLTTMQHDMVFTMTSAAVLIFLLIAVIKRSPSSSMIVLAPLLIGMAWTLGILGWLDIPLSIATVGLGAMILGLGTEYGIFLLERYHEERRKGYSEEKSLRIALPSIGYSIIGSGLATVIGFGVLVIAPMPMIQNLGKILALGIFSILVATVFAAPSIMITEEKAVMKIRAMIAGSGGDKK